MLMQLILTLAIVGQGRSTAQAAPDKGDDRLDFMKKSVDRYQFSRVGGKTAALRLQAEPAFRLGKQYTDVLEGAIFLWLGEGERPEAAVQVFKVQNSGAPIGLWLHEFTSLSPEPFVATQGGRTVWSPATPGVEFRPVPGAPPPADSVTQRTRQMRALAKDFQATDNFGKKGWHEVRLLTTPIARYGKPGTKMVDGSLFAFVEGTDPEVFLFVEARPGKNSMEWRYAFAPMTVFAVKGSYRGKTVWELPDRMPAGDPTRTFYDVKSPSQDAPMSIKRISE